MCPCATWHHRCIVRCWWTGVGWRSRCSGRRRSPSCAPTWPTSSSSHSDSGAQNCSICVNGKNYVDGRGARGQGALVRWEGKRWEDGCCVWMGGWCVVSDDVVIAWPQGGAAGGLLPRVQRAGEGADQRARLPRRGTGHREGTHHTQTELLCLITSNAHHRDRTALPDYLRRHISPYSLIGHIDGHWRLIFLPPSALFQRSRRVWPIRRTGRSPSRLCWCLGPSRAWCRSACW